MSFADKFEKSFKKLLPSPFSIALILTLVVFFAALFFTKPPSESECYSWTLLKFWEKGLWNNGLLVFAFQMMLMLVLGHVLALAPFVNKIINAFLTICKDSGSAAATVAGLTVIVSFFNWGLGLIFGAVFARKVADYALSNRIPVNYPLIGAAGYSGLMVWHGGISGSAPIKVAENGHLQNIMQGILPEEQLQNLPESVLFNETVFSFSNIVLSCVLIVVIPLVMFLLGKNIPPSNLSFLELTKVSESPIQIKPEGAEKIDYLKWTGKFFGAVIIGYALISLIMSPNWLKEITPNFINFCLLGMGLFFHQNIKNFLKAVDEAISGASGILIQFPLYFGIMGIMKNSGLIALMSDFFISISNETTLPIFTFISAGIVNVFVPSGGGQWAVQGPIVIKAALELGVPLSKNIMALAYGDQLTNMMQPFWALPLLGITKLKAKEILPYTLILMAVGGIVFSLGLLLL